jgi:Protein of unknown function (DUF1572)
MPLEFTTSYLKDSLSLFRYYKRLADGALAQITEEQLYSELDPEANSIAVIMKHMAGNMLSRWTDFLTSDGEKPFRDRESEFRDPPRPREALIELWEQGWQSLFSALDPLSEDDITRTITIRGEAHSVMQAINRQLGHYAYHCGQIVLLAKHYRQDKWRSLSIPRGRSVEFNRRVETGQTSQR